MNYLFITGLYRSGTTWLQKLMNQHASVQTFEQPCPPFYWNTKQAFLKSKGINTDVPIPDQFGGEISPNEFTKWLDSYKVDPSFADSCRSQAAAFSGTARLYRGHVPSLEGAESWFEFWKAMHTHWLALAPKKSATWIGSKEIIGEEFSKTLLQAGVKVVLIIRDPREVVRSLVNDTGGFMGDYRPTLFTVRMWRKSVAYAIHLRSNPDFLMVKYEDLKTNIGSQKERLAQFLGVEGQEWIAQEELLNEDGSPWRPNVSSRSGIKISQAVNQYIESVCWPEMEYLGYLQTKPSVGLEEAWKNFEEPIPPTHRYFEPGLSKAPRELELEQQRLEMLRKVDLDKANKSRWFIHPEAYDTLSRIIHGMDK